MMQLANTLPNLETKRRIAERSEHGCGGYSTLFRKELADHLHSVRFWLIFALIALTSFVSLAGAISEISGSSASSKEMMFLYLYSASSGSIPSMASFMAYLAPLMGIVLGFDAISREKSQGTIARLVSQPIHRDAVITAKFLAGAAVIALILFSTGIMMGAVGMVSIGLVPSAEEAGRVFCFLMLAWIYTALWLGFAIFCSVVCRHAATGALITIGAWIFLTVFASMIADIIANLVYSTDGMEGFYNTYSNYSLKLTLYRISPYYLFCEAASTLLNPSVRSLSVLTMSSYSGAVASYLSLDQSLLLIWPHIVCMAALCMAAFTGAYVSFMRREIRS